MAESPGEKKVPSLREERRYGLLYLVAMERPVGHITGGKRDTLPRLMCPPFISITREGDVGGVEKIADKETGKLEG